MTKLRVIISLITIIIVGTIGYFVALYARGYRFDLKTLKISPNGILVLKSDPDGAQVFIDGDLRTATSATLSLSPGTYDISIKKDGYLSWSKRLTIEKEVVTQATANLFKIAPSFTPVTFSGAVLPMESENSSRLAYLVMPDNSNGDKAGLWVLDTFSLPIGFSQGPRRITDGDLTGSSFIFSPDASQILLIMKNSAFLLDTGAFTQQNQRVNVIGRKDQILAGWETERKTKMQSLIRNLPSGFADILQRKAKNIEFSPDGTMVLYTASGSGELSENLITPLPGSSTQKQERIIKDGQTYIYDIKEDRNFAVSNQDSTIRWFPTSRQVIQAEEGKITIMDYDGTNKQVVYSGSYVAPNAFPYIGIGNLLILTNLGSDSSTSNLYSLTIK